MDELTGSAAGTFPQVDPSTTVWAQRNNNALIQDRNERADSSSPVMSAMFAMMKMFYTRQDTRDFWQESYTTCMDKLMRAEAPQRKLKKHVRKHKNNNNQHQGNQKQVNPKACPRYMHYTVVEEVPMGEVVTIGMFLINKHPAIIFI